MAAHQTAVEDQRLALLGVETTIGGNGNRSQHSSSDPRKPRQPRSPVEPKGARGLDYDSRLQPYLTLRNAVYLLETDRRLEGKLWFDDFLRRQLTANPPREWTDADDLELCLWMQTFGGIPKIGLDIVRNAAATVAFRNHRHCVRDWLDAQVWDQEPRIDHFFEDHFGAAATAYTRAASRNFWLSMVARVYHPGCKVDNMVVLEGEQGIGKSRALQFIAGQWFTEQHESVSGKGFFEVLQGKLLVEIGEMDSFSRADITKVKQVVTNPSDRYRESYGRRAEDHPRQCIFVGTTNKDDWNRDETGARRFWPIRCNGEVDIAAIRASREQFFAEAVVRFKHGESWWEMPPAETVVEQRRRYDEDAWIEPITEFIGLRASVTVTEVLTECLKFDLSRIDRWSQMRVSSSLKHLGWARKRQSDGKWCYVRGEV